MLKSGNINDALESIDKALEIDDGYIEALNNKASVLIFLDKLKEALEIIEKAMKIDDKNKELWNNKGYALQKLGNLDQAFESYNNAFKIDSKFILAIFNLACIEALRMNLEESIKYVRKILILDKNYIEKIKTDPYLENLRELDEFKELIGLVG